MKKRLLTALACAGLISGAAGFAPSGASADAPSKAALPEAFDRLIVLPFDYHDKAFLNGQLTDFMYSDYDIVERNGRIYVPIRLMSTLATNADIGKGAWDAVWQAAHPKDVLLSNANLHKRVQFTVGSKTMLVNGEPVVMDAAPLQVDGRVVLPLRSAAEALDKEIDWLDGLILIGTEHVDLTSPRTLEVKDRVKQVLTDPRKPVAYENAPVPLGRFGHAAYYYTTAYRSNGSVETLFRQPDGGKAAEVKLPGNPLLHAAKAIGGKLYFVTANGGAAELAAYNFADGQSRKIAAIPQWKPEDGWVTDIRSDGGELYVILHTGDLTMGGETLYKVSGGALTKVADAKSVIHFTANGGYLYMTDFHPMADASNNLVRIDRKTGASSAFGQPGFTYGISRTINDHGVGFGGDVSMMIQDGYLYTLGYLESDPKDVPAVYKIKLADGTQVKLTGAASSFWLADGRIVYVDGASGGLKSVDPSGGNARTLTARKAENVRFANGGFYYTEGTANGAAQDPGTLYSYDLAAGREVRLSDRPAASYEVGEAGVYYVAKGYEPGLYKVDASGLNRRLVADSIASSALTEAGMTYTLTYKAGVYTAQ
ncbi:stalk domain-containing protein [Paenibacillus sp. GCM10023250]|uniref:stalk domain-containing protein n=1 Tax=Paenibacillus sp. GCM10023250 TaxID=3252648 RepID=UPI00360E6B21